MPAPAEGLSWRLQEGLLQDSREGLRLQTLREVCLDGLLLVDSNTLHALQIFQVHLFMSFPGLRLRIMW